MLSESDAASGDRYKYVEREYEAGLGLYFNRARWYDPASGRFVGEDPLGFGGGDANLSRYVGNAPTNATDPSGTLAASEYGVKTGKIALPLASTSSAASTRVGLGAGLSLLVRSRAVNAAGAAALNTFWAFAKGVELLLVQAAKAAAGGALVLLGLKGNQQQGKQLKFDFENESAGLSRRHTEATVEQTKQKDEEDACLKLTGLAKGAEKKPNVRVSVLSKEVTGKDHLSEDQAAAQQKLLNAHNNDSKFVSVPSTVVFRIDGGLPPVGDSMTGGTPLEYTQNVAGYAKTGGAPPDLAGHIIHYELGGGAKVGYRNTQIDDINIVPLTSSANQVMSKRFESKAIQAARLGETVCAKIEFRYGDESHPARPVSFTITYAHGKNGGPWSKDIIHDINNRRGERTGS